MGSQWQLILIYGLPMAFNDPTGGLDRCWTLSQNGVWATEDKTIDTSACVGLVTAAHQPRYDATTKRQSFAALVKISPPPTLTSSKSPASLRW